MLYLDRELLDEVRDIAVAAGRETLPIYHSDFDVEHKADNSPLTRADTAAHAHIQHALRTLAPDVAQLSEEGGETTWSERAEWDEYWLIDPLDGTREFVKQNDEFTINIALVQDNRPRLGVVYAPALDRCWFAAETVGAFEQRDGDPPRAIAVTSSVPTRPRVLVSRSHRSESIEALLARMGDYEPVSIGSSLKFCLIAAGEADFYPRLGPTSEWDTAAGHAVLAVAGGKVIETSGDALEYNHTESLLNEPFLAFGDRHHDWRSYLGDG